VINTAVFTTTQTFAGMTGANLLAALNTTGQTAYAGIVDATLNAANALTATQLNGGTGHSIVMVENDANKGEYAVFDLAFNGAQVAPATEFTSATLIGTFDFGASINSATAGLFA